MGDNALIVELTPVAATASVPTPPVANPDSAAITATSHGAWIGSVNNDTDAKG